VEAAFPQLEILDLIGRGGMGVVYRVRQKSLNRLVALKLLAPGRERDPAFAERFAREARALAALNHPHIVTVHDFGFAAAPSAGGAGGYYFLLMEYVDGVNLRQAMKADRFTPEQALAVVPAVCTALQFAHERGIVHRDIKPENLLLDREGRIKIADFGIARMLGQAAEAEGTRAAGSAEEERTARVAADSVTRETVAGTPQYMAPEQRDLRQKADHRADIYSLGVVLYELLTGELPGAGFQAPSQRVQVDVRLDAIVLRALAVQPEMRYATAAEFGTQLATVVASPQGAPAVPRLLKSGTSTLMTPEALATLAGQFSVRSTRGQLLLDERQLTHSRDGVLTEIPLTSIRDLSIGRYPLAMNPAGIDLLSVSYDDHGQTRRVFLSPMEGIWALPSTWNARVSDWHGAILKATARAAGHPPLVTPPDQVPVPKAHPLTRALMLLAYLLPALGVSGILLLGSGGAGKGNGWQFLLFLAVMLTGGYLGVRWVQRFLGSSSASAGAAGPGSRVIGGLLLAGALVLGLGLAGAHRQSALAVQQEQLAQLAHSTMEEGAIGVQLEALDRRAEGTRTDRERKMDASERERLTRQLELATARKFELERTLARGGPRSQNPFRSVLPILPLIIAGFLILLRPRARPDTAPPPRRWMQWVGGGMLALWVPVAGFGLWIAIQVAHDSSWNPAPAEAAVALGTWMGGVLLLGGGLVFLALARPRSSDGGSRGGVGLAVMMALFASVVSAGLFITTRGGGSQRAFDQWIFARPQPQPRLAALSWQPVRVEENVVIINVSTEVTGSPLELRAILRGATAPPSNRSRSAAVSSEVRSRVPVSLARFGEPSGNHPWTVAPLGKADWQVGFVFPNAATAEEAFRGLHPTEVGEVNFGSPDAFEMNWEVFQVIASDGLEYRGSLQAGPVVASHHPAWVAVKGTNIFKEDSLRLTWEVSASRPGLLDLNLASTPSEWGLESSEARGLPTLPIRLELIRINDERVRLVREVGGNSKFEEWDGSFSDTAEEMLSTALGSAKGMRSEFIRLCMVRGQPVELRVLEGGLPGSPPPTRQVLWFPSIAGLLLVVLLGGGGLLLISRRRGEGRSGCGWALLIAFLLGLAVVGLTLVWSYSGARRPSLPEPSATIP